jgi:hypothetical protein
MIFMCCQSADPSVWVGIGVTPSTALPDPPDAPDAADADPELPIEPAPPLICPIALGAAGLVAAAARAVVESVRDDVPHADSSIPATASSAATASVNRGARVRQIHRRRDATIDPSVANGAPMDAAPTPPGGGSVRIGVSYRLRAR